MRSHAEIGFLESPLSLLDGFGHIEHPCTGDKLIYIGDVCTLKANKAEVL